MTSTAILTAILALFPYMSGDSRQCIIDRRAEIEAQLDEAADLYPDVPRELLASIAFVETHFGCDRGVGGNWGAPISPRQRHLAGTHLHAARALSSGLQACRSVPGAIMRFRLGFCNPDRQSRVESVRVTSHRYRRVVQRLMHRIQMHATR